MEGCNEKVLKKMITIKDVRNAKYVLEELLNLYDYVEPETYEDILVREEDSEALEKVIDFLEDLINKKNYSKR